MSDYDVQYAKDNCNQKRKLLGAIRTATAGYTTD